MPDESPTIEPNELEVHMQKSPLYRNIFLDGFWLGLTPQGNLHIALYSERPPIPTQISLKIGEGKVEEVFEKRKGKVGIYRELEVGLILSVNSAKELGEFLFQRAVQIEEQQKLVKLNSNQEVTEE